MIMRKQDYLNSLNPETRYHAGKTPIFLNGYKEIIDLELKFNLANTNDEWHKEIGDHLYDFATKIGHLDQPSHNLLVSDEQLLFLYRLDCRSYEDVQAEKLKRLATVQIK